MTDLDKMIASVEAGDADFLASDGWIEAWDTVAPSLQTYRMKSDGKSAAIIAYKAFDGSLDAALRLHEALLPGHPFDVNSTIGVAISLRSGKWRETADADEWVDTMPARAWLLAILRALKARGEA